MNLIDRIHEEAVQSAKHFRASESVLLEKIMRVETHRVFEKKGYASLFQYVTSALGLSESYAYTLIGVARKSREVPEMKALISSKRLSAPISRSRRVANRC